MGGGGAGLRGKQTPHVAAAGRGTRAGGTHGTASVPPPAPPLPVRASAARGLPGPRGPVRVPPLSVPGTPRSRRAPVPETPRSHRAPVPVPGTPRSRCASPGPAAWDTPIPVLTLPTPASSAPRRSRLPGVRLHPSCPGERSAPVPVFSSSRCPRRPGASAHRSLPGTRRPRCPIFTPLCRTARSR